MIRKTTNLELIRRLERICFPHDDPTELSGCLWWVCDDIAFAGMYYIGTTAFLYRAGVIRKARGQGLHKKLIKKRVEQAKKDKKRVVVTYASRQNIVSANNLIKCKFSLYLPRQPFGQPDAYYFRRYIDGNTRRKR